MREGAGCRALGALRTISASDGAAKGGGEMAKKESAQGAGTSLHIIVC